MPVRCLLIHESFLAAADAPAALTSLGQDVVVGRLRASSGGREMVGRVSFEVAVQDLGLAAADDRLVGVAAALARCHVNEVVVAVGGGALDLAAGVQAAGGRVLLVGTAHEAVRAVAELDRAEIELAGQVGVGPHPEPWPAGAHLDPELLAGGDRRNVVDRYRYWSEDAIVADMALGRHGVHVAIENWRHDHNIGAVVRNANAFNASGVHIVGRRRWNRRGAMATDRYLPVHHHADVATFAGWAAEHGLALVGIDNVAGAIPLEGATLPKDAVLVLGQEGPGLSPEALGECRPVCAITQYGSTRSLNAGVASGIALYAWARQHATPAAGS